MAGTPVDRDGVWRTATVSMDAFVGEKVRIRFVAVDGGAGNLVEAEIDDVRVTRGLVATRGSRVGKSSTRHGPWLDSGHEVLQHQARLHPLPC